MIGGECDERRAQARRAFQKERIVWKRKAALQAPATFAAAAGDDVDGRNFGGATWLLFIIFMILIAAADASTTTCILIEAADALTTACNVGNLVDFGKRRQI